MTTSQLELPDPKDLSASNLTQIFNPFKRFIVKTSPGNTKISCNFTEAKQWPCQAGFFCPTINDRFKCPPGFFCPENSAHPTYCCASFFCKTPATIEECPEGMFCPIGTTTPYKCHSILASCPPGTAKPTRIGVLSVAIVFFIIIVFAFQIKRKLDRRRRLKYRNELRVATADSNKIHMSQTVRQVETMFTIRCENLGKRLTNGIQIMKNVTGTLYPGRTLAIMGPSGAGKTTFVSLLTGKSRRSSGRIVIQKRCGNKDFPEKEEELSQYRKLIGFVPQEDVMLRELTVRDILLHSALMRLPTELDKQTRTKIVMDTIHYLGLGHVMDSIIGSEEERGISGGQRKRVNIGMELVAEPCILFLDEPTSGLDSSTALEVCQLLKRIARDKGICVASVIHSPSPPAFAQFDDLLLLGKGGQVTFFGPRLHATQYFRDLGFVLPPGTAEADWLMDIISGKVPCSWNPDFRPSDLFLYWDHYRQGKPIPTHKLQEYTKQMRDPERSVSDRVWDGFVDFFLDIFHYVSDVLIELFMSIAEIFGGNKGGRNTPSTLTVFFLCLKRAYYQVYRSLRKIAMECLVHFICGAFISLASQNMDYFGKYPIELCYVAPAPFWRLCLHAEDHIREVGLFVSLGVLFAGISVGVHTFGDERIVYWRDTSAGMATLPYVLAKILIDIPRMLAASFFFCLSLVMFWPYRGFIFNHFINIFLTYFSAFSMGYFLSAIVKRDAVALVGTGFALAWSLLFGGVLPQLNDVKQPGSTYEPINFIWDFSSPRYTVEYLYIEEAQARPWSELQNQTNDSLNFGYFRSNKRKDLIYITAIGGMWCGLAFLALKLMNRDKMK